MKLRPASGVGVALLIASLVAPAAAHAQRGGAGMAAGRVATAVRVQPATATRAPTSSVPTTSNHRASNIGVTNTSPFFDNAFFGDPLTIQNLLNPVPNPGFSFDHMFNLNQNLGLMAFIDPATQVRLAVAERVLRSTPFLGGGTLLLDGGAYVVPTVNEQPQPQQPIIIVQQPAPQAAAAPAPTAEQPTQEASEPLPDEGEFTLVLRDGTHIEAAAFTHRGDSIVYITPAGNRRSLAASDLDARATLRVNQERGTPLQLPL